MITDVALFPLNHVLFPGGELQLRIFERRYLDMVRDCSRHDRPFGVVLITRGSEVGMAPQVCTTGTLARIVDFNTLPDGLLGIHTRGEKRFHVRSHRVRDSGLIVGDVDLLPVDPCLAVPPQYGLLARIVGHMVEHLGVRTVDLKKSDLDDAAWVGYRLAEMLPLENPERQLLLEMSGPIERLQQLLEWLPRFQAEAEDTGDDEDEEDGR